jgi:hypothetical protein
MKLRAVKMAVVFWLGIILAGQSLFNASANTMPRAAKSGCCRTGCSSKTCATPVCCAKPAKDSRTPLPARPPCNSQNEFQALLVFAAPLLILPARSQDELPTRAASSVSLTAVPLFQRNCSYLI